MAAASRPGGASRSTRPSRATAPGMGWAPPSSGCQPTGSSVPGTWARASALFGETGPPVNTTEGSVASSVHGSSTWPTGTLVGRFSTTPSVPCSASCSTTRTTLRRKLGSPSIGVATSSRPARASDAISSIFLSSVKLLGGGVPYRHGDRRGHVRMEHRRDDVVRPDLVRRHHVRESLRGGDQHLVAHVPALRVEQATEHPGEGEHVVDLVRVVAAAGGHHGGVLHGRFGIYLGIGVGQREH